ncbi:hypothetical protein [Streptomyces sp. TRM68367]|uniref:hypothetical protein n=1 Tax=Streptomyces sp. TRM68367 TaxID=2758415 RepID=UPI00165B0A91|nr:hypothetical protein [Streptomyces sp. TRM68367]MBC9731345.1 hypothetical protein [Streptomyces sp. TRM68367]
MRPCASRPARDGDFAASRTRLEDMVETLSAPMMMAASQATLEEYVTEAGRELQRQLMQDQLDARARAEERRPVVRGSEGITRTRAESGHRRMIATTVGRVETERIAYRAEGKGVGNLHPADAVLELPARLYSQPLRKLIAVEVARSPARQAAQSVSRITGQHLGTRQLMATVQHAAADILDFYTPALNPDTAGSTGSTGSTGQDLLVMSIDATGVAMIPAALREATRAAAKEAAGTAAGQAPSAQLSRRDRAGRTRMASVTAVYDAAPVKRSPADILPVTRAEREQRREGPHARGRQLDASLERSTKAMVKAMFDTAQQSDPDHRRRCIVLVDGANHQLDCINAEAERRGVKTTSSSTSSTSSSTCGGPPTNSTPRNPPARPGSPPQPAPSWKATAPASSPTSAPTSAASTKLPATGAPRQPPAPRPTSRPRSPTSSTTSLSPWAGRSRPV